jgi:hypothetical protein
MFFIQTSKYYRPSLKKLTLRIVLDMIEGLTFLWNSVTVLNTIVSACLSLLSSSGSLTKERGLSRDLVHPSKKDPGQFRSIFQHIQAAQLQRSPSELFAQHIVTIVHYIKGKRCLWLTVLPVMTEVRFHGIV